MDINKLKENINNIKNKKNKFLFFIPEITEPAASIYEIFFHAHIMKKEGYDVKILVDGDNKEKPYWIEDEILDVDIELASEVKLKVGVDDVVVIPEILTNVFEQTKNIPSIRVGLLQSVDYMLNALLPGGTWKQFGVNNIITTSKRVKNLVSSVMGNNYNYYTYDIGIPSYFKNKVVNKIPTIPIVYRNQNDITKVVKMFYLKYPQYSWISFDGMVYENDTTKQLSRKDFAEKLDKSFAAIWIDKISSFGTFPLECMKCKTIPIGIIPDIFPEYLDVEDKTFGYWSNNIYEIPDMIANAINNYLEDTKLMDKIIKEFDYFDNKYTQENSEKQIVEIYSDLLNKRMIILEEQIKKLEEDEK